MIAVYRLSLHFSSRYYDNLAIACNCLVDSEHISLICLAKVQIIINKYSQNLYICFNRNFHAGDNEASRHSCQSKGNNYTLEFWWVGFHPCGRRKHNRCEHCSVVVNIVPKHGALVVIIGFCECIWRGSYGTQDEKSCAKLAYFVFGHYNVSKNIVRML